MNMSELRGSTPPSSLCRGPTPALQGGRPIEAGLFSFRGPPEPLTGAFDLTGEPPGL